MIISYKIIIPACLMVLFSCQNTAPKESNGNDKQVTAPTEILRDSTLNIKPKDDVVLLSKISIDSLANRFVENLENGKNLASFFNEDWIFVYHADNRCDGSTDGEISRLKSLAIDRNIKLNVKNDGEGWACEKTEPKNYDLIFNLRKEVKSWDRFQIPNYEQKEKNVIYIIGKGESDYLKLHYNDAHLIIKLEYRSEDPG